MIAVALSGGIDSAVAVRLLLEQGERVHGIFLKHGYQKESEKDASLVAQHLDVPLTVLDVSDRFEQVLDYFTDEYYSGRTPNPCVLCNRIIKFGLLYDYALSELGADGFATGHYVRRGSVDGQPALFQGCDLTKDQSYVLYGIDRARLSRLHFPLGELTKDHVRELAIKYDIPVVDKKESQDICFVENGCHADFLRLRKPGVDTAGNFVDVEGRVLAPHSGFEHFTVGQRKGMGIGFGHRIFVLKIDATTRNVVVGAPSDLAGASLTASDVRWLLPTDPTVPFRCGVKIRYRAKTAGATVVPSPKETVQVYFEQSQYGIAPGQSVVFYFGDRLIGGGVIEAGGEACGTVLI